MSNVQAEERAPLSYRLLAVLSCPVVRLLFRPRVSGVEKVPSGGLVLSANHLSGFDTMALGYPLRRRWLRHMAKPQLFDRRLLGPLVRMLGGFPASGQAEAEPVTAATRLARAGHVVVIMPEGARRRPDRVHRPRTGAARVALGAGVPLVPAAIRGTDRARRLARWEVSFGDQIPLDDLRGGDLVETARATTERLWAAIQVLEQELDRRSG